MLTRHSSAFQVIHWNWKHLTSRQVHSKNTLHSCATLCVSFSSKSKARDQSIQARNKLFLIVKNYLCNVLSKLLIKIESTWRRETKEQTPQLTLLYCGRTVRRIHGSCSIKNLFLKILQYPQEEPVLESLFKKVAGLQACRFIKKRPQHRCFPVNIAKDYLFWKTSANGCFLIVSMVHCYVDLTVQGLDSMTASDFRVQVTGLVFCF